MRWNWLVSAGAVLLAFLGSQHHNLMMLLFAVGLGNAGASLMTSHPSGGHAMLLMSLAMAGVIGYQISRPNRPGALSILITLGIAGWSLMHVGM